MYHLPLFLSFRSAAAVARDSRFERSSSHFFRPLRFRRAWRSWSDCILYPPSDFTCDKWLINPNFQNHPDIELSAYFLRFKKTASSCALFYILSSTLSNQNIGILLVTVFVSDFWIVFELFVEQPSPSLHESRCWSSTTFQTCLFIIPSSKEHLPWAPMKLALLVHSRQLCTFFVNCVCSLIQRIYTSND